MNASIIMKYLDVVGYMMMAGTFMIIGWGNTPSNRTRGAIVGLIIFVIVMAVLMAAYFISYKVR